MEPSKGSFTPSTLRVWNDLHKFDPSDHPSEAVSEASGLSPHIITAEGSAVPQK